MDIWERIRTNPVLPFGLLAIGVHLLKHALSGNGDRAQPSRRAARSSSRRSRADIATAAKARQIAEEERRRQREERQAEQAKRRAEAAEVKRSARAARQAAHTTDLEDVTRRIERGELRGAALRDVMASGQLRLRNPSGPEDVTALEAAARLSARFHGTAKVVELSDDERRPLPRFVVEIGELGSLAYEADEDSRRGDATYVHEMGDRGPLVPPASHRPLLVADPTAKRKRVQIISARSPLAFEPDRGLVG